MASLTSLSDEIHSRALEASAFYQRAEGQLIDVLQQVEEHRVFLRRGHSSLFTYVVHELGLAEAVAYNLIAVARKAREIPLLKQEIQTGRLSLTNARRVAPLLKAENSPQENVAWITKARELSSRLLEKEIVKIRPQAIRPERASYVTPERVELRVGLSEREMLRLRRAQDLLCQSRRRPVSLEETLEILTSEFLRRHDPVEKAKRHQVRKGFGAKGKATESPKDSMGTADNSCPTVTAEGSESSAENGVSEKKLETGSEWQIVSLDSPVSRRARPEREAIPAHVLHQVNLRDQRRCTHLLPNGTRCNETRWIDTHHIVHVCDGGENTLENLITLCAGHHRGLHLKGGCAGRAESESVSDAKAEDYLAPLRAPNG